MKQFETFELDTSNECLWRSGVQIALPPKPFAVLRYLVENPGRLVTHDELMEALWPETYVQPQVLRTYVLDLRKVLGDDAGQPRFIQTVPKRGYCFVAPVKDVQGTHLCQPQGSVEPQRMSHATPVEAHSSSANSSLVANIQGREEEQERLRACQDLVAAAQRQVVFVTGEAGIGKTALVDAFLRQDAPRLRGYVARGQCVEGLGKREDYYPVMEALSQLCSSADGEKACTILARMAPAWLAGLGRTAGQTNRPQDERLAGDLCSALEELAGEKPLLLVFEDLHWADEATIHLLSALARRRAPARLLVVAIFSPRNADAEHPLKALKQDLLVRRLGSEIVLGPLSKTAVKEILSKELKQEALPAGLSSFVHRNSEGNPLFVMALLEHLIAERFLVRVDREGAKVWEQRAPYQEMEAGVPDGLAQMIELEIERLNPEEQRMLEAGSLMNVAFPAWAVAAALNGEMAQTEELCEGLARRLHFVNRAGEDELPDGTRSAFYVFAHGLYREVLYQRQAPASRARRHVRIAERVAELFAGREAIVAREMAHHYEAAGKWQGAANALRSAARHAQLRQAHAEAGELLAKALHVAENLGDGERAVVLEDIRHELEMSQEAAIPVGKAASRHASGTSSKA
jgi:predicted ATPase/DNA-binding winged helix-turn-helix (wHTH) protein